MTLILRLNDNNNNNSPIDIYISPFGDTQRHLLDEMTT